MNLYLCFFFLKKARKMIKTMQQALKEATQVEDNIEYKYNYEIARGVPTSMPLRKNMRYHKCFVTKFKKLTDDFTEFSQRKNYKDFVWESTDGDLCIVSPEEIESITKEEGKLKLSEHTKIKTNWVDICICVESCCD